MLKTTLNDRKAIGRCLNINFLVDGLFMNGRAARGVRDGGKFHRIDKLNRW